MKFKIDSQVVNKFLDLIKTEEYPIQITSEGWMVDFPNREGHMYVSGKLNKSAFIEYPDLTENSTIMITNSNLLLQVLGRFSGPVQITHQDGQFLLASENKTGNIRLGHMDENEIKDIEAKVEKKPKVGYEQVMNVSSNMFHNSIKDASLFKSTRYELEVKDKVFSINVGTSENTLTEKKKVEYPDARSIFGVLIKDIFESLDGEVEVGLKTYYPLRISQKQKTHSISYLLAPIQDREDDTPETTIQEKKEDQTEPTQEKPEGVSDDSGGKTQ